MSVSLASGPARIVAHDIRESPHSGGSLHDVNLFPREFQRLTQHAAARTGGLQTERSTAAA
jgi:hypothetical protein